MAQPMSAQHISCEYWDCGHAGADNSEHSCSAFGVLPFGGSKAAGLLLVFVVALMKMLNGHPKNCAALNT